MPHPHPTNPRFICNLKFQEESEENSLFYCITVCSLGPNDSDDENKLKSEVADLEVVLVSSFVLRQFAVGLRGSHRQDSEPSKDEWKDSIVTSAVVSAAAIFHRVTIKLTSSTLVCSSTF